MGQVGINTVKREISIIGWDGAPFRFGDKRTAIVGAVFRGGCWLDGVISGEIEVDGLDSSRRMADAVCATPHRKHLRVIMLDGITYGGFNVVDIGKLSDATGLPVIAVTRDKPDMASIRKALSRFSDSEERWKIMMEAGEMRPLDVMDPKTGKVKKIWFQNRGIDPGTAAKVIMVSSTRSLIPEPLRVAHLIAHGTGGRR